jgi:hypothetical protein
MVKRQLSQRELKQVKEAQVSGPDVVVYNTGKQMIVLRQKPPEGGDFFIHEQSLYVYGKKTVKIPAKLVDWNQLTNLQKRGQIKILGPS